MPPTIAVIGSGSWATALIKILSEQQVAIRWWVRSEEDAKHVRHFRHNPNYLSSVALDLGKITPFTNLREAVSGADYVLCVVPAAFMADALSALQPTDFQGKKIITSIKGMIPERNALVTEYIAQEFGVAYADMAVIGGALPCRRGGDGAAIVPDRSGRRPRVGATDR